jgi:hypothetical protein
MPTAGGAPLPVNWAEISKYWYPNSNTALPSKQQG